MVSGRDDPRLAGAGTLIFAPRGARHTFANPGDKPAQVLGLWSPGSALTFIEDIGAALPETGAPDPARLADSYRRHHSAIDW